MKRGDCSSSSGPTLGGFDLEEDNAEKGCKILQEEKVMNGYTQVMLQGRRHERSEDGLVAKNHLFDSVDAGLKLLRCGRR